jgi:type VI protein secretion system component VasF
MPTDLDAAVAARKREAQAQTQTLVTMVSVWVIFAITLIANLILLILY